MSACDSCWRPGHCCNGFVLTGSESGEFTGAWSPLALLAELAMNGLPFLPLALTSKGFWRFWCPMLGADGRCTDYENRPQLCRDYEPGTDLICFHTGGLEAGDPTAPLVA